MSNHVLACFFRNRRNHRDPRGVVVVDLLGSYAKEVLRPELKRQESGISMDEMFVARLWMLGVIAMMVVFGVTALIGYLRASRRGQLLKSSEELEG